MHGVFGNPHRGITFAQAAVVRGRAGFSGVGRWLLVMAGVEEQLSVVSGVREGCRVVVVSGDLDVDTAGRLDQVLDAIPDGQPVLIDLAGVQMLTSAGVHVLLKHRASGQAAIFCPDGPVSKVLEIVQAHRLVPIYQDLDAALQSVGART